jgi:hypothetical protein
MGGLAEKAIAKSSGKILTNSGSLVSVFCSFPDWYSIDCITKIKQWMMAAKLLAKRGRLMNNDNVSTFGSLSGTNKWRGGVLAPNGCIYGIPHDSTTVLKIDPSGIGGVALDSDFCLSPLTNKL